MIQSLISLTALCIITHSKSFIASTDSVPYAEAQDWCEQQGLTLASILTAEEKESAHDECALVSTDSGCWLGLSDLVGVGNWEWDDNSEAGYAFNGDGTNPNTDVKPWDDGDPYIDDRKQCIRMRVGSSGYWSIYNCNNDQTPLCSDAVTGDDTGTTTTTSTTSSTTSSTASDTTPTTTTTTTTDAPSPDTDGYVGYQIYVSWDSAQQECIDRGLTLATVKSDEERLEAQIACEEVSNGNGCWLGLTDEKQDGVWKWVDGSTNTYNDAWASGHPKSGDKDCARMRDGTGLNSGWWVSYSCNSFNLAVLCNGQDGGTGTTKTTTTKSTTSTNTDDDGNDDDDDDDAPASGPHEYIYNSAKKWNWKDGMDWCREQGTYLATISSNDENELAASACAEARANSEVGNLGGCWIGLTDSTPGYEGMDYDRKSDEQQSQEGTFRWDDGSSIGYAFENDGLPAGAYSNPAYPEYPWDTDSFLEPRQYWHPDINAPAKDYVRIGSRDEYWMCLDGGKQDSTTNLEYILCNKPSDWDADRGNNGNGAFEMNGSEGKKVVGTIIVLVVLLVILLGIVIGLFLWCKSKGRGAKVKVKDEDEMSDEDAEVEEGIAAPMTTM